MFQDRKGMRVNPGLRPTDFIELLRMHFDDLSESEALVCCGRRCGQKLAHIAEGAGRHKGTISKWWKALRERHPKIVDFLN